MSDPVRPLVAIAAVEGLAGAVLLIADVVAVVRGTEGLAGAGAGTALVGVVLWALVALALGAIWLGLYRRRQLARTPFLLVQAFVLALVPLFWGSDVLAYRLVAAAMVVLGGSGLVLGLRPSVREALGQRPA